MACAHGVSQSAAIYSVGILDMAPSKEVVAIPIRGCTLVRPLGIIHLRRKSFNRAMQVFLDLLREEAKAEAQAGQRLISTPGCRQECRHGRLKPTPRGCE